MFLNTPYTSKKTEYLGVSCTHNNLVTPPRTKAGPKYEKPKTLNDIHY